MIDVYLREVATQQSCVEYGNVQKQSTILAIVWNFLIEQIWSEPENDFL